MLRHTLAESERLGLKVVLHNGDGWSHSGGYWIPVEKGMQRVVHSELRITGLRPKLSTNGSADGPLERLLDGDPESGVKLQPPPGGAPLWLQVDFDRPVRAGALRYCAVKPDIEGGHYVFVHSDAALQASPDGQQFRDVAALPSVLKIDQIRGVDVWGWKTATFAPVEAKAWRLTFRGPVELREATLIAGNRIQRCPEGIA